MLLPRLLPLIKQSPRIIDFSQGSNAGTPLTLILPKKRPVGSLALALIAGNGSAIAPTTPAGWTPMTNSVTSPNHRSCFKYMDGSEADTTSSTLNLATGTAYQIYQIDGIIGQPIPDVSANAAPATSAAPDALSLALANCQLWIAFAEWLTGGLVCTTPPIGYASSIPQINEVSVSIASCWRRAAIGTEDPFSFLLSGSASWRSWVFGIPSS